MSVPSYLIPIFQASTPSCFFLTYRQNLTYLCSIVIISIFDQPTRICNHSQIKFCAYSHWSHMYHIYYTLQNTHNNNQNAIQTHQDICPSKSFTHSQYQSLVISRIIITQFIQVYCHIGPMSKWCQITKHQWFLSLLLSMRLSLTFAHEKWPLSLVANLLLLRQKRGEGDYTQQLTWSINSLLIPLGWESN